MRREWLKFNRVVELGSFTRAATALNLPKARVTTIVQELEGTLHRAVPTPAGRLKVDMPAAVGQCVVGPAGTGILQLPRTRHVSTLLASGQLAAVLTNWSAGELPLALLYPQ